MGNINKKVDKLIAKRQWDKLLHNLGETNGDSKMKIAKACGVSGGSSCIDLLSVILNDREASDEDQAKFAASEAAKVDAAWSAMFGSADNSIVIPADSGNMNMDEELEGAVGTPMLGG